MSWLSLIWSKITLTGIKNIGSKIIFYLALLFRKKVFFAIAVYTTYQSTINTALSTVTGNATPTTLGTAFVSESFEKFLGVAPKLLEGLKNVNQGNFIDAAVLLWTAFAALYMLIFLYSFFRSHVLNYEVDNYQLALLLLVWALGSALIHDTVLMQEIIRQIQLLAGNVQGNLPGTPGVNGSNVSLNTSN